MTDMKVNGLRSSFQDARQVSPPGPDRGSATPSQSGRKMQYNFAKLDSREPRSTTASAFGSVVASPRYAIDAVKNETNSKPRSAMTS